MCSRFISFRGKNQVRTMALFSILGKGSSIPYFTTTECYVLRGRRTRVVVVVVVVLNGPGNVVSLRSSSCRLGPKLSQRHP